MINFGIFIVSPSSLTNFTRRKEENITEETITLMRFFEALAKLNRLMSEDICASINDPS